MTKSKASPPKAKTADIEEGTAFTPKFDADGLVAVVVTSAETGEVLVLAHMNSEALARTIETGEAQFWSRSRKRLWRKGEESGNTMRVVEMRTDCDQDALWLKVEMAGVGAPFPSARAGPASRSPLSMRRRCSTQKRCTDTQTSQREP